MIISQLPDELLDHYHAIYNRAPTENTLRWLRGELMQQVWIKLLNNDFMHTYVHGIVVECADGVIRCLFPQFFTYSADYPEKVLLMAIKNLGKCPCPQCLIKLSEIAESGTRVDDLRRTRERVDGHALRSNIKRAHKWLFTHGYAVTSKRVHDVLDARSLVPIQAAFSQRIGEVNPGFNFYEIFAPDLMHEFELGMWKETFLHLMCLLHVQGRDTVQEFDRRFVILISHMSTSSQDRRMCAMPTFGSDTIWKFWNNVSRQNRLAACDFEDFLITSLPAFEGLLPVRDDQTVHNMLFELVNWHALTSLRLQTTITLDMWQAAMCHMKKMQLATTPVVKPSAAEGPRVVKFNVINTYKYHTLRQHPDYVERSGSTDNHNTRTGELEHRSVKGVFARTNKHDFERQIAKHQHRRRILRGICGDMLARPSPPRVSVSVHGGKWKPKHVHRKQSARHSVSKAASTTTRCPRTNDPSELPCLLPRPFGVRYDMGESERNPINLWNWVAEHDDDPTVDDFLLLLRHHLVSRMTGQHEALVLDEWKDSLEIKDDCAYEHTVIKFNYPTYDMRRAQDPVNPCTHPDIMMLNEDANEEHPYWYARVLGVYHVQVHYSGPKASSPGVWTRINFLWVRWFTHDMTTSTGFPHRQLPCLSFASLDDPDSSAFGFIDPATIIRATYIMPSFHSGTTVDLLPSDSVARKDGTDDDYVYNYASMFVDRDMFM
ncbi:hypothetical protein NUW54_g10956 [Trametes sanguinea]|uniref:Uncharacterized protein n=1 Tax=Trametes sanguinea TaxID=158606 RepID=A0ACC1NPD8_9APHY|nr:hypothetical protein NUW54_g10956 [Trametes sanguinea]